MLYIDKSQDFIDIKENRTLIASKDAPQSFELEKWKYLVGSYIEFS